MKIAICDDDYECRLEPMTTLLQQAMPGIEVVTATTVEGAIKLLTTEVDLVAASLDHDYSQGRSITGIDIALALAKLPPRFPILCHTSSPSPGAAMQALLLQGGWNASYCGRSGETPDEWLRDIWLAAMLFEIERHLATKL